MNTINTINTINVSPIRTTVGSSTSSSNTNKNSNQKYSSSFVDEDSASASLGARNTNVYDMYKSMTGGYNKYGVDAVNGVEESIDPTTLEKQKFYDEMSGKVFEYTIVSDNGMIMFDTENQEKFNNIYPFGTDIHNFKLAELNGTGKVVKGVPMIYQKRETGGFDLWVYDTEYNFVTITHVDSEMSCENFFKAVEDYQSAYSIENADFWDRFLDEFVDKKE